MKIIHLADLHIGKRVNNFSMIEDQKYILNQILQLIDSRDVDTVIIAGDIYDLSNPSAEAVGLFDSFLTQLNERKLRVLITSGNHDSTERLSFGSNILSDSNIFISPKYEGEIEKVELDGINFYLFPHIKPIDVRRYFPDREIKSYHQALEALVESLDIDYDKTNLAICHQFLLGGEQSDSEELSVGGLDRVAWEIFKDFDYVALGHLHRPQKVGANHIRYSGSPLKYSFSEIKNKKSLPLISLGDKKDLDIELLDLEPLRDMREIRGSFDQLMDPLNYLAQDQDDYVKIVLTDENEIVDVMGKLRTIYPNIMNLTYDNKRTKEEKKIRTDKTNMKKDPMDLFEKFYKLRNNVDLDQEKKEIMTEIINDIWSDI